MMANGYLKILFHRKFDWIKKNAWNNKYTVQRLIYYGFIASLCYEEASFHYINVDSVVPL